MFKNYFLVALETFSETGPVVGLITLITLGGQVVRTANVNPAESLRHE